MTAEEVVLQFFKGCEIDYPTMCQAFRDHMTDDFTWIQAGFPTCHGVDESVAMMDRFRTATGYACWAVEIMAIADRDDTVLVERIDHLRNDAGEIFVSVPIVGVFHVRDGKIAEWHEYPDSVALGAPPFELPA
jgi:limonene-1,2-epoxide hydrolase